jgi:hypothetical protein
MPVLPGKKVTSFAPSAPDAKAGMTAKKPSRPGTWSIWRPGCTAGGEVDERAGHGGDEVRIRR